MVTALASMKTVMTGRGVVEPSVSSLLLLV